MQESCIFCRIATGKVPAEFVYQDDLTMAFNDIDPRAPVHVLIVPREHINTVNELEPADANTLGRMVLAAKQIASDLNIADSGYRLVMNCGSDAGQTVDHIHLHLLGGRPMKWPPG